MKRLILLMVGILFLGISNSQNCCEFPIQHLSLAQDPPPLDSLLKCAQRNKCGYKYLYASQMIRAYENEQLDSVDYFFEKFLSVLPSSPVKNTNDLKIIYLYAYSLDQTDNSSFSNAYFEYVYNNTPPKSALKLLTKINLARLQENVKGLTLLKDSIPFFFERNQNLTVADKFSIITQLKRGYYREDIHEIFKTYAHLLDECSNEKVAYLFLTGIYFIYNSIGDSEANSYWKRIEQSKTEIRGVENPHYYRLASAKAIKEKKYEQGLLFAKLALEQQFRPFSSTEELLDTIPYLPSDYLAYYFNYANSLLFQTRLGKGISPVQQAFDIYTVNSKRILQLKHASINKIVPDRSSEGSFDISNIIIIGTYLYQQTNDISYLNNSISLLEGLEDASGHFWTRAKGKARIDSKFATQLAANVSRRDELQHIRLDITPQEIFVKHQAFQKNQLNFLTTYSDFYQEVADCNIDLHQVQADLVPDSAGIVSFYIEAKALYRLLVTPDTIDIRVLSHLRNQAVELADALNQVVRSGQSTAATEDLSRELYATLFGEIDGLLPERLHIIAKREMGDIPFAALRRDTGNEPPRYLGVECSISRQFSIKGMQLLNELELNPRYAQPLGFAPAFENDYLAASELRQAGYKIPPLKYNAEELEHLQQQSAGEYLFGELATLQQFQKHAPEYSMLHLATHGISSKTDGLRSRLYLMDGAGEPTSLMAGDVGKETLNADLVVLSACETGSGGLHVNEGRIGLTKAFITAGARAVVSSDWAVDDHATAELMRVFYDSLAVGQTPDLALQAARKAYLDKFPGAAPYKWAAFNAYGGMVPPKWEKERSWLTSYGRWLLAGGLAFLGLLLYQRRRRYA